MFGNKGKCLEEAIRSYPREKGSPLCFHYET